VSGQFHVSAVLPPRGGISVTQWIGVWMGRTADSDTGLETRKMFWKAERRKECLHDKRQEFELLFGSVEEVRY